MEFSKKAAGCDTVAAGKILTADWQLAAAGRPPEHTMACRAPEKRSRLARRPRIIIIMLGSPRWRYCAFGSTERPAVAYSTGRC
jgi:hypothetical protein